MFEKFGEFHSAEELNRAAAGLREEGDEASVFALAQENGLDREDAEDYLAGETGELATPALAAAGRIAVWSREMNSQKTDPMERMAEQVIIGMLQTMITDPDLANAVMRNSSGPRAIYQEIWKEARKHATGTGENRMAVACGTDRQLKEIIRTYFLQPKKLRAKLAALYTVDGEGAR